MMERAVVVLGLPQARDSTRQPSTFLHIRLRGKEQ